MVVGLLLNTSGGGPQGATLGLLEYQSQSNKSADCVNVADRFKFVNLLTVGMSSYNIKEQIPSDIPSHNQFIPLKIYNHKTGWIRLINGLKTKK